MNNNKNILIKITVQVKTILTEYKPNIYENRNLFISVFLKTIIH